MTYHDLGTTFDLEDKPREAIWAYELSLQSEASLDTMLDLAVLYFTVTDPGYFSSHQIDMRLVDAAYPRAMEILALAETRFGKRPEITFWRLHMRERVVGETIPNEVYERLAAEGASSAFVALFAATQGAEHAAEARRAFGDAKAADTARKRYLLSFQ